MVTVTKKRVGFFIENPHRYFSELRYRDIEAYIKYLPHFDVRLAVEVKNKDVQVKAIGIEGKFGYTVLSNMSMGYIICLLSMIAIAKKQKVCFIASLLGENALEMLCKIAKGTDYIYLYNDKGEIPGILGTGILETEIRYPD